ncbi:MAG: M28 family peptidase [Gemmatimonadaceae bacterium]
MPSRTSLAVLSLVLFACQPSPRGTPSSLDSRSTADTLAIRRDVEHLASDALEGRGTGTAGNDSAAAYIARRFESLKLWPLSNGCLSPAGILAPRCSLKYFQPFVARSAAAAHAGLPSELPTQNVVAVLRGRDPSLANEYVVIGAHFDHLGRSGASALDPDSAEAIRNGADDNASGTAAVMELARLLSRHPPRRSVIFITFSGEELGLLGSQRFVEQSPVAVDRIVAMLNFDMVGRLRNDRVIVYGVETATDMRALVDSAAAATALDVRGVGDGFGPSDHSSFYARGIPVLHFFTDLHDDYHRATDDAPKVSAAGIGRVVAMAERVVRTIADRDARLTPVRMTRPAPMATSGRPRDVYLGSIPDMSAPETPGVRLTGVRAGSPADQAGIKAGDVIVEFDGKPVKDLYQYTDALQARQPGDTVKIIVLRKGSRVELMATLGRRGG